MTGQRACAVQSAEIMDPAPEWEIIENRVLVRAGIAMGRRVATECRPAGPRSPILPLPSPAGQRLECSNFLRRKVA